MASQPPPAPALPFAPPPAGGRVFTAGRQVRSTEVAPDGRLRLDTLARYLQEIAEDDVADSGWRQPYVWLMRRITVLAAGYPVLGDRVTLATFCSATGPRWAERTTTLSRGGTALLQGRAVWAAVGRADGRPSPLGDEFHRIYGPATGGRTVSARLLLPGPPEHGQAGRAWPLRASDFDTAGHVNNAVHWAAIEDLLDGLSWLPAVAEMEYPRPILAGARPRLLAGRDEPGQLSAWLTDGARTLAAARLSAAGFSAASPPG
jgi:acyl-ACP thioesterase